VPRSDSPSQHATCDPTLFPFPFAVDPALALNRLAKKEGWTVQCDTLLVFDRAELCSVREVWRSLCRPAHLPARTDFTFAHLKSFLRDTSILEVVREHQSLRYLHRLVGSAVVQRMGELTGKFLDDFLPPPIYRKTAVYFDAVVETRCPLRVVTDFTLEKIRHVRGEGLVLPLSADGAVPDMLLSVSYFTQRLG
jgi:hypothetical protein